MEFYKLFHKRTNFYELLEWVDRGFRPEVWEKKDADKRRLLKLFKEPLVTMHQLIDKCGTYRYL